MGRLIGMCLHIYAFQWVTFVSLTDDALNFGMLLHCEQIQFNVLTWFGYCPCMNNIENCYTERKAKVFFSLNLTLAKTLRNAEIKLQGLNMAVFFKKPQRNIYNVHVYLPCSFTSDSAFLGKDAKKQWGKNAAERCLREMQRVKGEFRITWGFLIKKCGEKCQGKDISVTFPQHFSAKMLRLALCWIVS